MAGRSLRASATGIQIIRKAIKHNDWKQDELKDELGLKTRQPITRLLAGEPIERSTFEELCHLLDLEVKDVAVPETEQPEQPRDIDVLVQQVRSRLQPFITAPDSPIGTMRMLSVNRPVPVDKIYIDLNVLEQLSCTSYSSDWWQNYDPNNRESFERFGLSHVQKRVEALSAVKNYPKLMLVGKPGAGKTTLLKSLAVECIQPETELFSLLVPLFVTLREFAKEARRTQSWDLLDYLTWLLVERWNGCDRASAEKILTQGRSLVLLDGLDEVPPNDLESVLDAVREFSYRANRLVITCRTQSQQNLDGFTDVEVADFTPEQVDRFVDNWFKTVDSHSQASLASELKQQLRVTQNKPVAELTITPVLLNLICVVFQARQGNLPEKRFKLYEDGMRFLLERIERRTPIDERLTIDVKEKFLAELALTLFEKNDYFPEQQTLEKFIKDYFGVKRSVAIKILKAFETETGLLIQRSAGYWSFSHLTFQEYFVAVHICNTNFTPEALFQCLGNYITQSRWREIFLIAVEKINIADDFLLLIKLKIDSTVAENKNIQQVLNWVNRKSQLVTIAYKSAAIRAFYYALACGSPGYIYQVRTDEDYNNSLFDIDLALVTALSFAEALAFNYDIINTFKGNFGKTRQLAIDLGFNPGFLVGMTNRDDYESILVQGISDSLNRACNHAATTKIPLEQFIKKLRNILNTYNIFPAPLNSLETESQIEARRAWWQEQGRSWTAQLRELMIEQDYIDSNWGLSDENKIIIQEYYDANQLLVDCLNRACNVSDEVKQEIEENLLLPIADIEKGKIKG